VTEDGGLWTWVCGDAGRLGHNSDYGGVLVPTRVATERFGGAKVVAAGHSAVVTADGAVYTVHGESVHGELARRETPRRASSTTTSTTSSSPPSSSPAHLLGARGRCLPRSPICALALTMSTHSRLGAGSGVSTVKGGTPAFPRFLLMSE